ncbi:MAG: 2-isopropylmalate synthase [Thaumarchaeota archaeon]|nr:2-isopropylmalate synthase [Nitrososphaerota archaeon]
MRYIRIFDTTLRDGEQMAGVALTPEDKLEIAKQLDELGVDTIEAGFAIVSEGEREAIRSIVKEGLKAEICSLARANKKDIDAAISCDVGCIHTFIATSDIHLKYKLRMSREEALRRAVEAVEYAKAHGVTVEFSAEDATRSDFSYLKEVFLAVEDAGADRIDVPDTVGIATPERMKLLISDVTSYLKVPVSVHCHNDFGLATANSLAGIEAGASQAHVTVNGIGERAGNASLEEVVMALQNLYGFKTGIRTEKIYEVSRLVRRLTGVPIQPNKAIVGDNAFSHEAGIHVHGILSNPFTYEPISPESVGRKRVIEVGKHAGKHGLRAKLEEYGIHPTEEEMKVIFERFKRLSDRGKRLTDTDLLAVARDVVGGLKAEKFVSLEELAVMTGSNVVPTASVKMSIGGKVMVASETGVGPVDAAVKAIRSLTSNLIKAELREFRLEAITGGSDALGEALVRLEDEEGNISSARAVSGDIVMASVEALVNGINKLILKRELKKG